MRLRTSSSRGRPGPFAVCDISFSPWRFPKLSRLVIHPSTQGAYMWIVRVALNRPYTFIVVALLILILSPIVILRTPTDIFPEINIPVIAVVWNFNGMSAEEMEGRMTSVYERVLTTLVNNVEHIESMTVNGLAVVKVFLQANASVDTATAQVTGASQTILRQMPPGVVPP